MRRVKIYGAGSIGNHLAHAARTLGWTVIVCDTDPRALERMETTIYPSRYGAWDRAIGLHVVGGEPTGGFDLICVGTPPDAHLSVARRALAESPVGMLIEKPLCTPDLGGLDAFREECARGSTRVFVGYDHVIGRAARHAEALLRDGAVGSLKTLDVEFREHWAGIFSAHPWLNGPTDSYLGFWRRGGGASGEHSHAVNLWQHFAHTAGGGPVRDVTASVRYVQDGGADYDDLFDVSLQSEHGLAGRVIQDVVTRPSRKRAVLEGERGSVTWTCAYDADGDAVTLRREGRDDELIRISKTRADDFLEELRFIDAQLAGRTERSPALDLDRGIDTMRVIQAAHRSQQEGRRVAIAR